MINKRGLGAWIWIILILIIIGIVIYFLVSGSSDGGSSIISRSSSIPQPPALPS